MHLTTADDLDVIYDSTEQDGTIDIGRIAGSGISARLHIPTLVSRHASIVGSTGAGKSNLVALLLESLGQAPFTSARILVIDPTASTAQPWATMDMSFAPMRVPVTLAFASRTGRFHSTNSRRSRSARSRTPLRSTCGTAVSKSTVQDVWSGRDLKPHLVKTFKLSNDRRFEEKLVDVVGLYPVSEPAG